MDKEGISSSLISILLYMAETERCIETQRKAFLNANRFDSFGFFRYLDKAKKNYITLDDINTFLSTTPIKYSNALIKEIMRSYDKDKDTCWNYAEFSLFTGSKASLSVITEAYSTPSLQEEEALPNCEKELSLLFKMEVAYLEYLGIKLKSFKELPYDGITPKGVFDLMKGGKQASSIGFNELFFFVKEHNAKVLSEDIRLILQRLTKSDIGVITLSLLQNVFAYDELFLSQEMTEYKKTQGYYKVNPIYATESLYYTAYTNHKRSLSKTHLSSRSTLISNRRFTTTLKGSLN